MIDHYDWAGGREAMIRFGPTNGPIVMAAMPLFEEANRTRAFVVTILRALAERGIASVLPDLPGTGESLTTTEEATLSHWTGSFSSLCEALHVERDAVHGIGFRGGALLDGSARLDSRWHFAPAAGDGLVRDLMRTRLTAGAGESPDEAMEVPGPPIELAGNRISRSLLAQLGKTRPVDTSPRRTVRLDSDAQPADRHLPGSPLWRRSEPDNDIDLARLLAEDIAAWIASCAG